MRDLHHLATRAAIGDQHALEQFLQAIQSDIWRYHRHLAGTDHADDLTQETLIRVVATLRRWTHASPLTWALGIARNVAREHHRSARRRARILPTTRAKDLVAPDFGDYLATVDLIHSLDRDQRETFILTQQLGLSYAETADVLGCPIGTVRSRIARARDALANQIDEARNGGTDASSKTA